MLSSQIQGLEGEPSSPVIYVNNDALAFFDVTNPNEDITDVLEIDCKPLRRRFPGPSVGLYNFLVKEKTTHYFRMDGYEGVVKALAHTGLCIVISAHTINGVGFIAYGDDVKSSGVYHAHSMPPSEKFKERLYRLIDTVREKPDEEIIVKAVGSNKSGEDLKTLEKEFRKLLAEKGVEIDSKHLLLGKDAVETRISKFYPQTGQLYTYNLGSDHIDIL